MFQAKVGRTFTALYVLDSDVDTLASSLKEVLLSIAEERETEEENSTPGHKRGSGSVQSTTAADTTRSTEALNQDYSTKKRTDKSGRR